MFCIVRVLVNLKVQTMFLYQSNGSLFRINKALKDALCAPGLRVDLRFARHGVNLDNTLNCVRSPE